LIFKKHLTLWLKNTYYISIYKYTKIFYMKNLIIFNWLAIVGLTCCLGNIANMPDDWFPGIRVFCVAVSTSILAFFSAKFDNYSEKRLSSRERTYETKLYLGTAILAAIILMICCITNCPSLTTMTVWMISLIGICVHRISHNEFV